MTEREICRELEGLAGEEIDFQALLARAVGYLHESNERFHWTGIYELYPDNVLRLGPFAGSPTDHVFIAVGRGVCGTAVAENRNVIVPDVRKVPHYLGCSSDTRSELVVLIRKDGRIYAQIDIASHVLDAFDKETVSQVQAVADWLANAYTVREGALATEGASI